MGVRSITRDFFFMFFAVLLIRVWLFDAPFTNRLGFFAIIMLLSAIWFQLERFGILPKM